MQPAAGDLPKFGDTDGSRNSESSPASVSNWTWLTLEVQRRSSGSDVGIKVTSR